MFSANLTVPVPTELVGDFLARLPFASGGLSRFTMAPGRRDLVLFDLRPGAPHPPDVVATWIAEIAQTMCADYRPTPTQVLVSRRDRPVPATADPHPLLEAAGQLKRFGPGRYGLGPVPLKLLEAFDRSFRRLETVRGAAEHRYPSLVGADLLHRCRYLQSFPHALSLVSHLREDFDAIRRFAQAVRWDGDRLEGADAALAPVQCLLAPTVCFHHYGWLEGQTGCADHVITALGKCFRYESTNLSGLERLWDFSMREVVFVGSAAHVLEQRRRALSEATALLDAWELNYEIAGATDPFFIEDYSAQVLFQKCFDLKFEVSALLPYSGRYLAIGSFNYHQDFFGRSLAITTPGGEPVHTGCVGFGLERVALAVLAQHGVDPKHWPKAIRAAAEA